ncbi:MAG TPA: ABC transporter permease, partial [Frankiaceae bacterium]|nr:ABC transporter permease [Frankiaceae bacterium]
MTADAAPAPGPGMWAAMATVYRQQLARGRVARVPLLFVAAFQSIGLLLLLRGVV